MSGRLHRLRLEPDLALLNAFGQRRGAIPRGGDLGYALHAALAAAFGAAAPKPFRLLDAARGRPETLLAYTPHDAAALRDYETLQRLDCPCFAEAEAALGLDRLAVDPMPERWAAGRRYRFQVRLRPVVRTGRGDPRGGGREVDALLQAPPGSDREAVYRAWTLAAFIRAGGAAPAPASLALRAVRRSRLHTGDNAGRGKAGGDARVEGPEVMADGVLDVSDPDGFAALLARGLGRHRSFGFGMVLVAPAP